MGEALMITEVEGNLLRADVDALVNTVNTVGVMGKGIALQFKRAYPAMFTEYARTARQDGIAVGSMHVWPTGALTGPRYVINFPTKAHWKARSRLQDVESGLDDLVRVIRELGITSIAVPPLGCGNGGLSWATVRPMIAAKLGALDGVDVRLFPPAGAPRAADMPVGGPPPEMTPGRAALVAVMARYTRRAAGPPSLIEIQKLTYFLQLAGEPLRLEFVRGHYGPYADRLRHTLQAVEGHYVQGFGDGSRRVEDAEPLVLMPDAEASAAPVIEQNLGLRERIESVMSLIEGFESAYSLELLATVHWVLNDSTGDGCLDPASAVADWNTRKGRLFTERHVEIARDALRSRGWLAEPALSG